MMTQHEFLTWVALVWTGFCFTVIIALLIAGMKECKAMQILQAAMVQKLMSDGR